jgi:hypothetical protein
MRKNPALHGVLVYAALFAANSFWVFAQENAVDSEELQKAAGPVEFISNTAAPTRIDTREQILELGRSPGRIIRGGASTSGARGRYFVISNRYPEEFDKLDADIFGLGASTSVDTITNLRLIIQGYLQSAYDYTPADAALLAEYITIYNAVYRQNRPYFERRYKTPLLANLTPGMEGIALSYRDWPGSTMMLIPLATAVAGSLSAIDTSAITEDGVIDKMREQDDRGIGSRQDMVDLKEREAQAAEAAASAAAKANADEQRRVEAEREKIAAEQRRAAEEKARLEKERAQAEGAERAEIDARLAELEESERELEESSAALDESSAELAQAEEAARAQAEFAERKAEEAQKEREAIAADQRELIAAAPQNPQAAEPSGILAVRLSGAASPRGTVIKVNPASGATLQSSALNQVSARTLTVTGGKVFAVAASGKSTRLIEIDGSTLRSIAQGNDDLNADTQLWVQGASLYALSVSGGKNHIARFDLNLAKQAESTVAVHPWAALNFQGERIITQDDKGRVILLNAMSLSE